MRDMLYHLYPKRQKLSAAHNRFNFVLRKSENIKSLSFPNLLLSQKNNAIFFFFLEWELGDKGANHKLKFSFMLGFYKICEEFLVVLAPSMYSMITHCYLLEGNLHHTLQTYFDFTKYARLFCNWYYYDLRFVQLLDQCSTSCFIFLW